MSTFGEWLRNQRNERRLTREELAQRVACSVSMLRKMEEDERRPSAQVAVLIANAFGIPAEQHATFVRVARGELGIARLPPGSSVIASAPSVAPSNLPVNPTPLIGRRHELDRLCRLVSDPQCRLLTLVGPGGIGKTRLAVEIATHVRDGFADGAYFVPLAPVDSGRLIVPVLAYSIGYVFLSTESAEPKTQLINYLKGKRMLLLIDNVEHLLGDFGLEFFAELLTEAPHVQLLVTSRECLGLQAESVFEVQGLPVPQSSEGSLDTLGNSVELFLQRARRAHVSFDATTSDYPAIVRICQLLDGTPLAIELAAAWVRTLTCEEITREIELNLDFLRTSARDLPPRHRSMRAAFDHSWKLLPDDERRALARLSVFRGGFCREAAEQVAGASLGMLAALAAKSLVRRPEAGRYDLHELIRQYAVAVLDADPAAAMAAREQHYAFYLALAKAAAVPLKSSGQLEWLRRLEQERDNFRAALVWSLGSGPYDSALRLAGALSWFWQMQSSFQEGCTWLMKALEQSPQEGTETSSVTGSSSPQDVSGPEHRRSLACALEGLAHLTDSLGKHPDAYALAERSVTIYRGLGDKQGLADALMTVGQTLLWQGEEALARSRLEEALALYRELGDQWNVARSLYRLGNIAIDFGKDGERRAMLEESSTILDELGGDKYLSAGLLLSRGTIAYDLGDYGSAASHFHRSLDIGREIGDPWGVGDALTQIGFILRTQGDFAAARSHLEEALRVYQRCGTGVWCADPLCGLAENEMVQGNLPAANSYLRQASLYAETPGYRWLQVRMMYIQGLLVYYEADIERAAMLLERSTELARGSHFRPDLPRSLVALGRVLRARGETLRAIGALTEGLTMLWKNDSRLGIAMVLEEFAGLEVSTDAEGAVRWFSAAEAIRSTIGAPMPPVDRADYERDVAAARARLGEAGFAEAWGRGQTVAHGVVVAEVLALFGAR